MENSHLKLNETHVSWLELSAFQGSTATSSAGPWRTTEETFGLPSSGRTTFSASWADTLWKKDPASKNAQVSPSLMAAGAHSEERGLF